MSTERLARTIIHQGPRLHLYRDRVRLANGLVRDWEVLEQPPVAVVLPYRRTADGRTELLFVEQYRYAISSDLLEFPAGIVEAGEDPAWAARRELAEETGFEAEHWVTLPPVYRMPGLSNERTHFYLATGLTAATGFTPDPEESIVLHWLSVEAFEASICAGQIIDGKSLCLWALARPHLNG